MNENFDPIELAKNSKTFCIYPWIQQYVGTAGNIQPCCIYRHGADLGNLKENSLKEIWNSEKTKELRLKFLNGEEEPNCLHCNDKSRGEQLNPRRGANSNFFYNRHVREGFEAVKSTLPDGSVPEHKLYYIDVRFNNLCNFSCRTCSPHFSTNWIQDYRKLHDIPKDVPLPDGDTLQFPGKTEDQALNELIPHLPTAKTVYFAGGEPLIQKEHYETLQQLIESNNTNVDIVYNTNFSKLRLGEHDAIEYWKKFRKIYLNASIDGSHEKAEYWRHGTVWSDIVDNLKRVKEECPHVQFSASFSLSWVNAINALEFHREWVELGYIQPEDFLINIISGPWPYSLKNIPDFKKEKIKLAFLDHVRWLDSFKSTDRLYRTTISFLDAIKFMETSPDGDLHYIMREFGRLTKKLDNIRNENFFETFPEHADINDYMTRQGLHTEL